MILYCKYCYDYQPTFLSADNSVILCAVCAHGIALNPDYNQQELANNADCARPLTYEISLSDEAMPAAAS